MNYIYGITLKRQLMLQMKFPIITYKAQSILIEKQIYFESHV